MTDIEKKVLLIRELHEKQYKSKLIQIITESNQAYVSKIINNKLYKDLKKQFFELNKRQAERLNAVNRIISCVEYPTNSIEEEHIYIHVLKFFLVDKKDIYNLYSHWSKSRVNKILMKKDVSILDFDSERIGIKRDLFLDLILDYFID